ncbi:MAG: c-type cytochrome [Betaproteobacteria bacterium]
MMIRNRIALLALALGSAGIAEGAGDAARGAQVFRACAACHALEPDRNLTGPSLSGVWGRKAGSLESFLRYSAALKKSGLAWNEATLDAWLRDPQAAMPGNYMGFAGLRDDRARADLVAFLLAASKGKAPAAAIPPSLPDLKTAPAEAAIASIRHCGDSYFVTNGKGETRPFWEFNLRMKTDSSTRGPAAGKPVLVGQGMQGDRAQVVFARPEEISAFIREGC